MPATATDYRGIGMIDTYDPFETDMLREYGAGWGIGNIMPKSERLVDSAAQRRLADLRRMEKLDQDAIDTQFNIEQMQLDQQLRASADMLLNARGLSSSRLSEQLQQLQTKNLNDKRSAMTRYQSAKLIRQQQQKRLESDELAMAGNAKADLASDAAKGALPFQKVASKFEKEKRAKMPQEPNAGPTTGVPNPDYLEQSLKKPTERSAGLGLTETAAGYTSGTVVDPMDTYRQTLALRGETPVVALVAPPRDYLGLARQDPNVGLPGITSPQEITDRMKAQESAAKQSFDAFQAKGRAQRIADAQARQTSRAVGYDKGGRSYDIYREDPLTRFQISQIT